MIFSRIIIIGLIIIVPRQMIFCQTNPIIIGGYMEANGANDTGYKPFVTTHNIRAFFWTYKDQLTYFPNNLTIKFFTMKDSKLVFTYKLPRVYVFEKYAKDFNEICSSNFIKPVHNVQYDDWFNIPANLLSEELRIVAEPVCCRENADNFSKPGSKSVLVLNLAPYNSLNSNKKYVQLTPTIASAESFDVCTGQNFSFRNYAWGNSSNITSVKYEFVKPITENNQNDFKFEEFDQNYSISNLTNNQTANLKINANGIISGNESKPGKYRYVIKVSGFQDSLKICEIFNEFILNVKDCPRQSTPSIFSSKLNNPNLSSPNTICEDSLLQLNVKNFMKGGVFQWFKNGILISGANDSIFVVKNNEKGQYSLKIHNVNMCNSDVNSNTLNVNFLIKPSVTISSVSSTGTLCQGGTVKITGTSNPSNSSFQWQKGNQNINGATKAEFDASESGQYRVKITSPEGCINFSSYQSIITNSPPKAEITSNKKALCKDGSMILSANQEVGHSYEWFKDGSLLNINTSSLAIIKDGNYYVKITSINTCSTTSKEFIVVQKEKPIVNISNPNGSQLCQGTTTSLSVNATNFVAFQWLRNGSNLLSETKNNLIVTQEGNYTISVIDTNGCENTSTIEKINIVNKVEVKMDSIPSFCGSNNSASQLKGTPSGGVFNGKGIIGNEFYPNLAGIGHHKISYTVSGSLACLNGSAEREITVSPVPSVKILNPNDGKICSGEKVNISTDVKDGNIFQWYKDNLAISGAILKNYETYIAGKYKLEVKNQNNCVVNSDEFSLEIFTKPNISLDSLPNLCGVEHPPIPINYLPLGGILNGKGIIGNNFDPKLAGRGEHIITYKFTGNPSCTSGEISRKVIVTSTPNLNLGPDKTIHNGQFVKLNGDLGVGYEYLWSPNNDLDNPVIPTPQASPKFTTIYKLKATGPNSCSASDSIKIEVIQNIYVPNVFTPNFDEINDTLQIINLEYYPKAEVSIYDRWGKVIFRSDDYQKKKFDGIINGVQIRKGNYNYSIINKTPNFIIKGNILIN